MRQAAWLVAVAMAASSLTAAVAGVPPPLRICGRVRDASTGLALSGVHVEARSTRWPRPEDAHYFQAATDSSGAYDLVGAELKVTYTIAGYDSVQVDWTKFEKPCEESTRSGCFELRDVRLTPYGATTK